MRHKFAVIILAFALVVSGCTSQIPAPPPEAEPTALPETHRQPDAPEPEREFLSEVTVGTPGVSQIFVEPTTGVDDGVERLIHAMEMHGQPFYRTQAIPWGLFGADDVIILKINCQWDERGGTNTDLIRLVIGAIVAHPDGFTGEVIVADNGQGQFGSAGSGGSLSWTNNNAVDQSQSATVVINDFAGQGHRVTGVLWDTFTRVRVGQFSEGDYTDGFVVEDEIRATGLEITYPKFTTEFGTHVSFREGIWDSDSARYDSDALKVINMPVLKSHFIFQVTGAVKNYMGTPSDFLTSARAHHSVGTGGMGTQMAQTRMPTLNILDMIWIAVERGPASPYSTARQMNLIAASTDPVALDYWAARHVLIPAAAQLPGGGRAASMDPAGDYPGTFGHWLRLSKLELQAAGFPVTMNPEEMNIIDGRE
ncbi:MAG: DUF362 domain-containing protein [Oscillospiraceae bacterium]|nr:DUF362 domain-containing protein [Oscillospiraceae bacterium]